jgi:hypothetical protein
VLMGVDSLHSDAAKAFVERERMLGRAITILGDASQHVKALDRDTLTACSDLAHDLLPLAPGYAGKLLLIVSRLFSSAADMEEEGFTQTVKTLSQVQTEIDQLELEIG